MNYYIVYTYILKTYLKEYMFNYWTGFGDGVGASALFERRERPSPSMEAGLLHMLFLPAEDVSYIYIYYILLCQKINTKTYW